MTKNRMMPEMRAKMLATIATIVLTRRSWSIAGAIISFHHSGNHVAR